MMGKAVFVSALACMLVATGATRSLQQDHAGNHVAATFPESSALYPALESTVEHFSCKGGNCAFSLSDRTGPGGKCVEPTMPRIPGNENPTMEEFCAYHQQVPASQWDHPYAAAYPMSTNVPNGELVGCIIGNNLMAAEARMLPGWAGKGFDGETGVFTNLVRLGMLNDSNAYPGNFYPVADPEGGYSWKLDYGVRTNVPIIGPALDFMINRFLPGRYIRNMGAFEDYFRELAPGIWMGKSYALPFMLTWDLALGNPTPFRINVNVPFLLFQSCPK